jgi:hypothetical protein
MAILSSVILALTLVATVMAVLRLFDVRVLLSAEEYLVIADKGPRNIFAFATHYFFGVFLVCVLSTSTDGSVCVDINAYERAALLACFCCLTLITLLLFL